MHSDWKPSEQNHKEPQSVTLRTLLKIVLKNAVAAAAFLLAKTTPKNIFVCIEPVQDFEVLYMTSIRSNKLP